MRRKLRGIAVAWTSVVIAASLVVASQGTAMAYPLRTHVPWAILLCQFSGSPAPPHDPQYYADMYINRGTGGVADYFSDVSYGSIDFAGSIVKGWYTLDQTLAQEQAKVQSTGDKHLPAWDCQDKAANDATDPFTVPSGYRRVMITSPPIDAWGQDGVALLQDGNPVVEATHEMGHAMGMDHSFSNNMGVNYGGQPGEYDDAYDMMSQSQDKDDFPRPTARFGSATVGLNGFQLDRAGWIPYPRVYTFGQGGEMSATTTLAALNHPEVGGSLLVRIPFDPGDLMHYYTVELRTRDGWDASIYGPIVLFHEVMLNARDNEYRSYLLRDQTTAHHPVTSLNANGVTVSVNWISGAAHQASISITGNVADLCLQGYVWREAQPSDHVCVTGATRDQTAADNAAAPSRVDPNGAYGPDSCVQGYVWREAYQGDHVCVTQDVRTQAAADNAAASSRNNPSQYVYGPTTCASGYVWREADASDHVCVPPATRDQAAADNAAASSRVDPNGASGPDSCVQGYVWREAFLTDHVCVTPDIRTQASDDNAAASNRIAHA
jgi:hypothetical protein